MMNAAKQLQHGKTAVLQILVSGFSTRKFILIPMAIWLVWTRIVSFGLKHLETQMQLPTVNWHVSPRHLSTVVKQCVHQLRHFSSCNHGSMHYCKHIPRCHFMLWVQLSTITLYRARVVQVRSTVLWPGSFWHSEYTLLQQTTPSHPLDVLKQTTIPIAIDYINDKA